LARKRKVPYKNPKRSKGVVAAEPPPSARIREFPDQSLTVVRGKLFCEFYWNNCRIITICFGIIDAFSGIKE
jgi:hypothetical protein